MFSQTTYMYKDYGDVFWRWDKSEEFPGSWLSFEGIISDNGTVIISRFPTRHVAVDILEEVPSCEKNASWCANGEIVELW
jgi:hypothetical protein